MGRRKKTADDAATAVLDPPGEAVTADEETEVIEPAEAADQEAVQDAGADEAAKSGNPPGPPRKPSPVEEVHLRQRRVADAMIDLERYHTSLALDLFHAENTVKTLRKDREAAITRLAAMQNEAQDLAEQEAQLKTAPAPLFEHEIADEWREFNPDVAGIAGDLAKLLHEAGIETLGEIAALNDSYGSLIDVRGIGPEKAAQIADKIGEFFAANPRYCRGNTDEGPRRIPARIKLKGAIEGDDYTLADGSEWDVDTYENGIATVPCGDGCVVDVPFGSYRSWPGRRSAVTADG